MLVLICLPRVMFDRNATSTSCDVMCYRVLRLVLHCVIVLRPKTPPSCCKEAVFVLLCCNFKSRKIDETSSFTEKSRLAGCKVSMIEQAWPLKCINFELLTLENSQRLNLC